MLDEQSFQDLLSAAFTIQEHNDRLQSAPPPPPEPDTSSLCPHCGALKSPDGSRCPRCDLDEFRPGERLQRNWASMWLMSQQQGLWPDPPSPITKQKVGETGQKAGETKQGMAEAARTQTKRNDNKATGRWTAKAIQRDAVEPEPVDHFPTNGRAIDGRATNGRAIDNRPSPANARSTGYENTGDSTEEGFPPDNSVSRDRDLVLKPFQLPVDGDSSTSDFDNDFGNDDLSNDILRNDDLRNDDLGIDGEADITAAHAASSPQRLSGWRVILRFHRADLYLGVAVFVSLVALLAPAALSPRRTGLGAWERALITLGIAEAPPPAIHFQGDPTINVWIDPHSALYYCPGEDEYGKAADGRITTQHDAQMDRFEPAGRSVCE